MKKTTKILFASLMLITFLLLIPVSSQITESQNTPLIKPFSITSTKEISDNLSFVKENGYRVSWSHSTNRIAFDQKQTDGYYDVYLMNPDGTNEQCLTDYPTLPKGHKGCADWHPTGEYIVFSCQKDHYFGRHIPILKQWLNNLAIPGEGLNCDLWLTNADGTMFWQLTDLPTKTRFFDRQPYTGVLHPHFSHDGSKLLWSERIDSADNKWGEWTLNIADFVISNGQPHLENITICQPGHTPCFYESHGFSPDDSSIIFSGNLQKDQDENHLDIYTLDLQTDELNRLTTEPNEWDEHAHYSPDGKHIIWMSSNGYSMNTKRDWWNYLKTEYWMMNPDGSNKTQLTFYNNETNQFQRVVCSDCSFNQHGTKLAITLLCEHESIKQGGIVILDLTKHKPIYPNKKNFSLP